MAAASGIVRVVVGTAGHIDHGKSSLVRSLTGTDPDRLPEEKARGLTIDLGFANLRLSDGSRLGIVDVPGHEKFVHNMVAGATGIDLALLVVAADDGVMPQTIEHLEILELLGLRRGAIALTKIDLVSPEHRAMALDDVRETVRGTFLEEARVFTVSSETGEGIEALRAGLESLARETPSRDSGGIFRMPVQRVFAAKGFGCVLTGIPVSGSLAPGDPVEVLPVGARGTARKLEAFHAAVERVQAGHSSAINVAGVDAAACRRGMVVAEPDAIAPASLVEARLQHLARRRRALRDRERLRFHVGTLEVGATVALLDRDELAPGDSALVQLRLDEPIVVAAGDRFLVRRPSPAATIGGGVVIGLCGERLRRRPEVLADLAAWEQAIGRLRESVELALRRGGDAPQKVEPIAQRLAAFRAEVLVQLGELCEAGRAVRIRGDTFVHRELYDGARERIAAAIDAYFREHPERLVCDRNAIRERAPLDDDLIDHALADLAAALRIEAEPGGGARAARPRDDLSETQRHILAEALARLEAAGFQPPDDDALAAALRVPRSALDPMLKRLVDEKRAVRVAPGLHFATSAVDLAKLEIAGNCEAHRGELDLPSLRDALGTTRRWLIPLMEWLDAAGFTTRLGGRRILKRRLP